MHLPVAFHKYHEGSEHLSISFSGRRLPYRPVVAQLQCATSIASSLTPEPLGCALKCALSAGPRARGDHEREESRVRHVLLISIDGMHALDFENCVKDGTCPHLADLGGHGVTYSRTSASKPSDSAPRLMALVTGGTPKTTGVYYDVACDRVLAPPLHDTAVLPGLEIED